MIQWIKLKYITALQMLRTGCPEPVITLDLNNVGFVALVVEFIIMKRSDDGLFPSLVVNSGIE